ncbi:LapB repeat-containing protein [Listeria monocytogenes]
MNKKLKYISLIGIIVLQCVSSYPLKTLAEENNPELMDMETSAATNLEEANTTETTIPESEIKTTMKEPVEEKTSQKTGASNNLKRLKRNLQAGETYESVFPDAALATVIAKAATGSEDITQEVSQTDLNKITSLTATSKGIVDLTGINLLSKLASLSISGNQITDISALNGLANLSNLNVSSNQITSFNLNTNSNLPMLDTIDIRSNNLNNINVQDQSKLRTIKCDTGSNSELTELTLKNLPTLLAASNGGNSVADDIAFSSTPGLSKVILENLPSTSSSVQLDRCVIEELVINNLPKVSTVTINNNNITTLEGLGNLSAVINLNASGNLVTEIENIHAFPSLQTLNLSSNTLTNLIMNQATAEKFPLLRTIDIRNSDLIKLEIQDQPKLATILCDTGSNSELTELTLKNLPTLLAASNGGNSVADDIAFSSTPGLSKVILENLPSANSSVQLDRCVIEELVINDLPNVSGVNIYNNKITTLEGLENLTAVSNLNANENLVTEIENMHALPSLNIFTINNNHISVLPISLKTKNPVLTTLSATNQTITLKQKVIVSDLVLDNEVKNFGQTTTAKSISNNGTYQNNQITWLFEDVQGVNAVDYQFSEPIQEATIQGTFSGKVTQPIKASTIPVISADAEKTYSKNTTISEAAFFKDISASVTDDAILTSDFESVVDFTKAGTYEVTLNAMNEDGVEAVSVTVLVHIAKSPAPVITADKEITYTQNTEVNTTEFLATIHATTNDGSPIESDLDTTVNWSKVGDYTVTLSATNEDGVEAIPVKVTVHIVEPLAPTISNVTFDVDGVQTTESHEVGELVSEPLTPTKEGYNFIGWYDAKTGGNKWNFATDKMPANDITLYAQFSINQYTATFDVDGKTTKQMVDYQALLMEPAKPTKEGYTFTGWYDAKTGGNKWHFATGKMPANNLTLYAQFTKQEAPPNDNGKTPEQGSGGTTSPHSQDGGVSVKASASGKSSPSTMNLPKTGDEAMVLPIICGVLCIGVAIFLGFRRTQSK